MKNKKHSLKYNAILNALKQCMSIIFPLFTFPYVSHVLGSDEIGKYSFASSIANYFILIAVLGINSYAIREGSRIRDDKEKLFQFSTEIYSINIISSIISIIGLCITFLLSNKVREYYIIILIKSVTIILTVIGRDWINSIYEDYLYLTSRYLVVQVIAAILMFGLVKEPSDIYIYSIITVFAASGGNILNIFYIKRYMNIKFTFKFNIKKHFKPIIMLFINAFSILIYVNADVTMLGIYCTDSDVGVYSFISKIYNLFKQFINALVVVALPRCSYVIEKNLKNYNEYLKKIVSTIIWIMIPACVFVYVRSKEIIFIAGGKDYVSGEKTLRILMVAVVFAIAGSFYSNCILVVNRREKYCLVATLCAAFLNILLNIVIIPKFGIVGAAVTTVFAELLNFLIQVLYSEDLIRIKDILMCRELLQIIGGSILVYASCLIINWITYSDLLRVGLSALLSGAAYILGMLMVRNKTIIYFLKSCMKREKRWDVQ